MRLRHWLASAILVGAASCSPLAVDAQESADGYRAYQLRHAEASDIAASLRRALGDESRKTEILVERRTNRLLVQGSSDAFQIATKLIEALDKPPTPAVGQQAPVVQSYSIDPAKLEAAATDLQVRFPAGSGVRIAPDQRTGQILVVAPPAVQTQIAGILGAAKAAPPALRPTAPTPAAESPQYLLSNITWRELEQGLRDLWGEGLNLSAGGDGRISQARLPQLTGGQVVLQIDRQTNRVTFGGPNGVAQYWQRIVTALDSPRDKEQKTALVPLRKADPAKIQKIVALMRDAALSAATGQATAALPVDEPHGRRPRTGADLVSMIFRQQDQANQEGPAGQDNQPAPPANADPAAIADALQDEAGLIGDVQIEFVPELGVIILRGNQRDVARVRRIIDEIREKSDVSQPEIDVYELKHVNSLSMAELINPIYEEIFEPRQGSTSITALGTPNALLLIGTKENLLVVRELIEKLDQPVSPTAQIKVFQLKFLSSNDAAQHVQALFAAQAAAAGQQANQAATTPAGGLAPRVNVVSDFRSNSLIVQASPRDMIEIEELLTKLDVDKGPATMEVKVFPLKNALSDTLQQVLQAAISGQATTGAPGQGQQQQVQGAQGQSTPASTSVQVIRVDQMGNKVVESGILNEVTITSDANTNSLIVRAPANSMELIATLIEQLDAIPEAESQIKVFEIKYGDATNLTVLLQQLFGQDVTVGSVGAFRQTVGNTLTGALAQSAAGESSLIPLTFSPDPRTNSIVASGSAADLAVVEALLVRLDEDDMRTRRTTVYRLNNAGAEAVSTALTNVLNQQLQLYSNQVNQQFSTIGQYDFLNQQIFVVPEPNTNSLIVNAVPQYYDLISEVIADLDRRPPMVMIQCVIAEMVLDAEEETGSELGLQDSLLFDRGLSQTPLGPISYPFVPSALPNGTDAAALATRETLAGQAFSAFNLGRSSGAAGFAGMVLAASNESISILIRALESRSRIQVLSRPQVMTLNNVPASILVGQRVPQVTDFQATNQGTVNAVTLVDVGLSMGVIPRVTPDGLIVMDLEVTRSSISDEGVPIGVQDGVAIDSPIFNDTTAVTTLSARDGQTIVFSGLISKDRGDTYRGVPFLSNIPLFGRLFRFDVHADRRTELLIFMTPHIVNAGENEDVDWINLSESERMSWCLADLIEMHGDVGLSAGRPGVWSPKECPVIFPHADPTGAMLQDGGPPVMLGPVRQAQPLRDGDADRPFLTPEDQQQPQRPYLAPSDQIKPSPPYFEPARHSTRRREMTLHPQGQPTPAEQPVVTGPAAPVRPAAYLTPNGGRQPAQPPAAYQPAAYQPAAYQPAAYQPAAYQPAGAQPAGAQPAGSYPPANHPGVYRGAATQPANAARQQVRGAGGLPPRSSAPAPTPARPGYFPR